MRLFFGHCTIEIVHCVLCYVAFGFRFYLERVDLPAYKMLQISMSFISTSKNNVSRGEMRFSIKHFSLFHAFARRVDDVVGVYCCNNAINKGSIAS